MSPTKVWIHPREGTRWLIMRRTFRHGCFGFLPRTTLQLACPDEYWVVREGVGRPPPLTDAYLMGVLEQVRRRHADERWGEGSRG